MVTLLHQRTAHELAVYLKELRAQELSRGIEIKTEAGVCESRAGAAGFFKRVVDDEALSTIIEAQSFRSGRLIPLVWLDREPDVRIARAQSSERRVLFH